jgi:hypothetical protein
LSVAVAAAMDNRENRSCARRAEAGHDHRNRDLNRTGAAHVVQLMSRFR